MDDSDSERLERLVLNKPHVLSKGLPNVLVIKIASFLSIRDLSNLARSDRFLLMLLLRQNPLDVMERARLKKRKQKEKDELKRDDIIESYKSKEELAEFEMVQNMIWKPLLCYHFPQFALSNNNIKNWLHVLRRRVTHLSLYAPHMLPLEAKMSPEPFKISAKPSFIENCEFNYKCPLRYESLIITGEKQRYCGVCDRTVYQVDSAEEFNFHVNKEHCVSFVCLEEPRVMGECVKLNIK